MRDLVERLRSEAVNWSASCGDLFDEAADRIEALEAALREIVNIDHHIGRIVCAALAEGQDK